MKTPILIATPAYEPLRCALARELGITDTTTLPPALERRTFADGETYLRFTESVRDRHVILIGATQHERDLVELLSLGWQAARDGAEMLSLVIPYFGYSTMERAVKDGEVVRAKTNAVFFSVIPTPPGGKHIYLVDLHAEGIPHYFEGGANVAHLYAQDTLLAKVRELISAKNTTTAPAARTSLVVGSADTGRAKWVESYARALGASPAFITKRRFGDKATEVLAVSGANVRDCTVLLYDDMIRSGTSILNAIRAYRDAGAVRVIVATTHLVLQSEGGVDVLRRLLASGISELITTDTVAHAQTAIDSLTPAERARVHVVSVSKLISQAIQNRGRIIN